MKLVYSKAIPSKTLISKIKRNSRSNAIPKLSFESSNPQAESRGIPVSCVHVATLLLEAH